jgi:CelD/BcsL family acetyltransferase involved in cellulose biosynthesis
VPWWRHFHPGTLFCVTVRDGARLVGLAPVYVEDGACGRRILPLGISLSDYLDVLLDAASEREAGAALVQHLRTNSELWDGWDLEELPPEAVALRLPTPEACEEDAHGQSACPVLALPPTVEQLAEAIPARKLRKLRMARHRAERRGPTVLRRIDDTDAAGFLQTLFDLHDARWNSRGEEGVLADARVRRFQEEALPGLVRAGFVRLYAMEIGGRTVGAYYGFLHDGRAYAYLGGFDPEFAHESPGTVLIGHAIEEAVREGAREFDFLRGREPYKYEWGAVDRWNRRRSFRRVPAYA